MLKSEGSEELINLDNLDDSVDDFLSNKSNNFIENKENGQVDNEKTKQASDTILNEEINTQNLPASPPFTKVSTIKMFSRDSAKPKTPLKREALCENLKENRTATLARKDHTKSFLPRIKKRQKQ